MGLLERFFGPPTKDQFGKLVADTLRMTPLDCYPPRWSVDDFPTKEQLQQMQTAAF
jgi:hypothetical protein